MKILGGLGLKTTSGGHARIGRSSSHGQGGGQWDIIGFGLRILSSEAPSRQYMSRLVCCDMSP